MLILYETSSGFALFKLKDETKVTEGEDLFKSFETIDKAHKIVSLEKFKRFKNTADALKSATALIESKMSKNLKKFLTKEIIEKGLKDQLAISDPKLGSVIKEKLKIKCIHDPAIMELYRGIRSQIDNLISDLTPSDANAMSLGLSHSLSRYKLRFSPDKVDTMIVQAISLLDDLDKELNIYAMRVREWYGWHFPELSRIIPDNILFAKTVKKLGNRTNAIETDFSDFLPTEYETDLKEAAKTSMGTEISEEDIENIRELCDQVISISEYREQLFEYLKNRMNAIAPNLTLLVGELVGARLIAHAGSLLNLAKHPASTVQILGAEKALFRALKTKHETPKYGLIYHASLVGQSAPKNKGKISRVLAAKAALAARYDALGEGETNVTLGTESREKVEKRLRTLEGGQSHKISGSGKTKKQLEKYDPRTNSTGQTRVSSAYNSQADTAMEVEPKKKEKKNKKDKKQKQEGENEQQETPTEENEKKKRKKEKKEKKEDLNGAETTVEQPQKGKRKAEDTEMTQETPEKKKKQKKH